MSTNTIVLAHCSGVAPQRERTGSVSESRLGPLPKYKPDKRARMSSQLRPGSKAVLCACLAAAFAAQAAPAPESTPATSHGAQNSVVKVFATLSAPDLS